MLVLTSGGRWPPVELAPLDQGEDPVGSGHARPASRRPGRDSRVRTLARSAGVVGARPLTITGPLYQTQPGTSFRCAWLSSEGSSAGRPEPCRAVARRRDCAPRSSGVTAGCARRSRRRAGSLRADQRWSPLQNQPASVPVRMPGAGQQSHGLVGRGQHLRAVGGFPGQCRGPGA